MRYSNVSLVIEITLQIGIDNLYVEKTFLSILLDARIQSNTCQEEANTTDEDVCGEASREKRASENLEILKDHRDDPKQSDIDVVSARQCVASDKTEIEIESIHRHLSQGGSSEVRSPRHANSIPGKRSVTLNFAIAAIAS